MDDEYDAVVMGTGLKECVLSGLLSVGGMKVLHVDRNSYYGGESASLNLSQLWELFRPDVKPDEKFGINKDWNVDLIPKFIMADGLLVKILLHTDVSRYLEFRSVDGSYVSRKGKINKVPATDLEAAKSPLMGIFEKIRAKKFFQFVQDWEPDKPKSHQGCDVHTMTMAQLFKKFGLEPDTIDFVGHALGMYLDDAYLERPALETIKRCRLYAESLARYSKSPFIYPRYGLGELPQAFARLAAIHGGTYMLRQNVDEVVFKDGVVYGVRAGDETAKCKLVVGDPSYFPDKSRKCGQVVRCICIMNHPVPNTGNADSVQVIIPARQMPGRKKDIYVTCISSAHDVCLRGYYVAIVSTYVETSDPAKELEPGIKLLGPVLEKFLKVTDLYEPDHPDEYAKARCFISSSFDPSSHFESTSLDIMAMYKRITGKDLDLTPKIRNPDEEVNM